jgi:type II secretory pathway predicted ATPase ExeA
MSRIPVELMQKLREVETPDYQTVAAKANEFLARTGLAPQDLASRLGIGESTLRLFIYGRYGEANGTSRDTQFICARVWPFITARWPKEEAPETAQMLETRGYRKIRECLEEAITDGAISILYGPPSSEKSFVLENLCAQFREAGQDAVYIYCTPRLTPTAILREVARASQIWLRSHYFQPFMHALRTEFLSRKTPPALVFDEAQHLSVESLETIRALHDRTRKAGRKGCGIILAGSHNLYRDFESLNRRSSLEQWLSRISYRVQLEGMSREEVLTIAARAFGNGKPAKLSEAQRSDCLGKCTVMDNFASSPRPYFSSRRLLEYVRQQKRKNVKSVLAENVA